MKLTIKILGTILLVVLLLPILSKEVKSPVIGKRYISTEIIDYTYSEKYSTAMTFTAYTPFDPCFKKPSYITASGDSVRHGIVAVAQSLAYGPNALLPLGTFLKIGEEIYQVKDVMHEMFNNTMRGDIWMHDRIKALEYGIKHNVKVSVLKRQEHKRIELEEIEWK